MNVEAQESTSSEPCIKVEITLPVAFTNNKIIGFDVLCSSAKTFYEELEEKLFFVYQAISMGGLRLKDDSTRFCLLHRALFPECSSVIAAVERLKGASRIAGYVNGGAAPTPDIVDVMRSAPKIFGNPFVFTYGGGRCSDPDCLFAGQHFVSVNIAENKPPDYPDVIGNAPSDELVGLDNQNGEEINRSGLLVVAKRMLTPCEDARHTAIRKRMFMRHANESEEIYINRLLYLHAIVALGHTHSTSDAVTTPETNLWMATRPQLVFTLSLSSHTFNGEVLIAPGTLSVLIVPVHGAVVRDLEERVLVFLTNIIMTADDNGVRAMLKGILGSPSDPNMVRDAFRHGLITGQPADACDPMRVSLNMAIQKLQDKYRTEASIILRIHVTGLDKHHMLIVPIPDSRHLLHKALQHKVHTILKREARECKSWATKLILEGEDNLLMGTQSLYQLTALPFIEYIGGIRSDVVEPFYLPHLVFDVVLPTMPETRKRLTTFVGSIPHNTRHPHVRCAFIVPFGLEDTTTDLERRTRGQFNKFKSTLPDVYTSLTTIDISNIRMFLTKRVGVLPPAVSLAWTEDVAACTVAVKEAWEASELEAQRVREVLMIEERMAEENKNRQREIEHLERMRQQSETRLREQKKREEQQRLAALVQEEKEKRVKQEAEAVENRRATAEKERQCDALLAVHVNRWREQSNFKIDINDLSGIEELKIDEPTTPETAETKIDATKIDALDEVVPEARESNVDAVINPEAVEDVTLKVEEVDHSTYAPVCEETTIKESSTVTGHHVLKLNYVAPAFIPRPPPAYHPTLYTQTPMELYRQNEYLKQYLGHMHQTNAMLRYCLEHVVAYGTLPM
jgi:hypothetical protein